MPPVRGKILTLVRKSLGGIFVFWENVARDADGLDVVYYAAGARTGYDPERRVFVVNQFDPLAHVYARLKDHLALENYDVLVANESFELDFFGWLAPRQTVCFIVHVNHQYAYEPALRHAGTVDHFFCVSEAAVAYLQARGIRHVSFFRYATFVPVMPAVLKRQKVVYVGRFEPDKNISETIDLLLLFRSHGYAVSMIGGGSLSALVHEALPAEDILIGPPRERIFQELAESRFLCHNSYVEGLPIVHTEAIHFGLGVICNYVDKSIAEVVGENALLWSDRDQLLRRMAAFVFRPPPGPPRVNNPTLNPAFLAALRNVGVRFPGRRRIPPPRALDRLPLTPPAWVRLFRQWRWARSARRTT